MQMRTFSSIDLWKSVPRVRRSRLLKVRPSNFLMECAKTLNAKGFSPWRGGSRTGPGRPLRRCFQRLNSLVKTQLPQGLKPSQKKEGFIAALKALRHPKARFSANRKACSKRLGRYRSAESAAPPKNPCTRAQEQRSLASSVENPHSCRKGRGKNGAPEDFLFSLLGCRSLGPGHYTCGRSH